MIELLHIKTCVQNEGIQMAKKLIFKGKNEPFPINFQSHRGSIGRINYLLLYQPSSL